MANDAKFGLVVGVGLVVAFAVVFFHKDSGGNSPPDGAAAAVPTAGPEPSPPRTLPPPPRPQTAVHPADRGEASVRHTVREGDTLFSLAQQYYGDVEKSIAIYRVNRSVLKTPDQLSPGMVLTIPDLPRPAGGD